MKATSFDLEALTIKSPCQVPWETMRGTEAKRFCDTCQLHVHDVSEMTRAEVEALVEDPRGHACLRLWRRPDGRVITKDCQRVRRAARRALCAVRVAGAGLLALFGLGGCHSPRLTNDGTAQAAPQPPPLQDATVLQGR